VGWFVWFWFLAGEGEVGGKGFRKFARISCWLPNRRQHLVLVTSLSDLFEYLSVNNLVSV